MAKLCDIVKPGVPAKVKIQDVKLKWDGAYLLKESGELARHEAAIFYDCWELDEPSVESILRERGYMMTEYHASAKFVVIETRGRSAEDVFFHVPFERRPTTAAQATAICDLLDQYRK